MSFRVNGEVREWSGAPESSLLDVLRGELGITSPKNGCSPQAACGCCTVRLDGKPVLACVTPMSRVEGRDVQTIEGLAQAVQHAIADAFAANGGAQCGFCIPGIVMRAAALLEKDADPSEATIEHELRQHLCRCTGYKKIVRSIRVAAEALREGTPVAFPEQTGKVGTRLVKHDVREVVLGRRPYVADMTLPGMAHAALRLSDHPRAKVLSIDVTRAAAMPGVRRVFGASDVPGQRSVGLIVPDWPLFVAPGETTRYVGDVLAMVVADTIGHARAAVDAIEVAYEVETPVTDVHRALEPGAPQVHANGNRLSVCEVKKGDVDAAFARCAHVAKGVYQTQRIEHAYMEPECALAEPLDDGVHVFSQSQGVYEDRRQIALLLGLDEPRVRVTLVPNGGGFGGKEDLSIQGHAALAAYVMKLPVRLELSREESLRLSAKRHPIELDYELGCDAEGRLLALRARIVGDTGAYASVGMKVLERAAGHATGAYDVPNVDIVATTVYTNNVPCGAMRGFGANQATFALESCVDELCALGGFDRWQFRWDNALVEGRATSTGQVLASGVGVRATLEAVRDAFRGARFAGIACGLKNTGIGNGMPDDGRCKIVVRSPTRVEIHHGWTEMGQGVDTMAVQTLCEATGLSPAIVAVLDDTASETRCGMTTASRATSLVGNAVLDACKTFASDLAQHGLEQLVGREYRGEWICDWTNKPGKGHGKEVTHYSYSYATQVVILDEHGGIERVIAAHDAGRVMNPTLFEGQIEGSVHMGLGYALTEDFPMTDGRPDSLHLRKCGVLRADQTPAIEVIGVEVSDEFGPFGAKGVGEIGLVPTAGAVANALFSFDGVRRRTLPMMRR
ncbi:MAG: selenium-dependent xanthine dehydrogenase [Planctomycetes bacterium]|nr:selenium-dependent xanthine dehydrogenase [Planctomycetota bacterium]